MMILQEQGGGAVPLAVIARQSPEVTCSSCGEPLAPELAGFGRHLLCMEPGERHAAADALWGVEPSLLRHIDRSLRGVS